MHDQLNGPFGDRIILDKVFSNYLSACIIDYTLIVQEWKKKNMEVQIWALSPPLKSDVTFAIFIWSGKILFFE